nr:type I CRISPR-associated protein Cas7 [Ferrimicrobium acidiphilum]
MKPNKEILFYYESRQNPNGDPGFENQPRLMSDDTIMVTDVRIKRTIRDYARDYLGQVLFVDDGKDGKPVTSEKKASELLETKILPIDTMRKLLLKTFDTPLFGALVPLRKKSKKDNDNGEKDDRVSSSFKLTGPVQFAIGRSVNKVKVINPLISGRFVGKEKGNDAQESSTFGKFYSVEYALIKITGIVAPANLGKYGDDKEVIKAFNLAEELLALALWNGTNSLISRSKYPQRSVLYLEVTYKSPKVYNDLSVLVNEKEDMKGWATALSRDTFDFSKLLAAAEKRKGDVDKIRIIHCDDVDNSLHDLVAKLKSMGVEVEDVSCQTK